MVRRSHFQISTVSMSWTTGPTAFRLRFRKCIYPKCIYLSPSECVPPDRVLLISCHVDGFPVLICVWKTQKFHSLEPKPWAATEGKIEITCIKKQHQSSLHRNDLNCIFSCWAKVSISKLYHSIFFIHPVVVVDNLSMSSIILPP